MDRLSEGTSVDGRDDALRRLAAGAPLEEVLEVLVSTAERAKPDFLCSVLLLDRGEAQLRHGAAPSLPEFYNEAIDGLPIGPTVGSCGAAAHLGARVIVEDIMTHSNWVGFRDLAQRVGVGACWSEPIRSSNGDVLGTFAMYYREPRSPGQEDIRIIESIAHLAGIAIECRQGELERAALAAQLRQQQKLDAIGSLASGVAHEINNPIQVIMNYAQLIQKITEPEGTLREYSDGIFSEATRVATIVRQLLAFSRQDVEISAYFSVEAIVGGAVSLLKRALARDKIELEVDLPDDLPEINCRGQQIQQVVVNAVTNARDAVNTRYPEPHPDKRIRISARPFLRDKTCWIRVTVEDHGTGITPRVAARIFDPFFTTKAPGQGTGLGLSVSQGIVAEHSGVIRLESEPDQPTRFHLELPENESRTASAAE